MKAVTRNISTKNSFNTPDQDCTDFQKSLDILKNDGVQKVDVYGGSGGEQDQIFQEIFT